jgi:hypothetical protein
MQMRRAFLAWIEQITAMNRQDIGQAAPSRECLSQWTSRHDEMGVDNVERATTRKLQSAREARRQVRKHGREVRDRKLFAKEHRHAHHAHAVFDAFRRQPASARRQHRHLMTQRQLSSQRCHDDAATTAQRRVLVVTKKDFHNEEGASSVPLGSDAKHLATSH